MEIRPIDDNFAVTGQLAPEDISAIAAAGYKSLICNRPDGESAGQPEFSSIADAAEKAGLTVYYVPVIGGQMTQADVDDMAAALSAAPQPVLAYCRSGTRCTNIYDIVRQQQA